MTLYQIFIKFCEENKILGDIYSLHLFNPTYTVSFVNGEIKKTHESFQELIERHLCDTYFTMQEKLYSIMSNCNNNIAYSLSQTDKWKQIFNKWKYFVKNNIISDDEQYADGKKAILHSLKKKFEDYDFYICNDETHAADKYTVYVKMVDKNNDERLTYRIAKSAIVSIDGEKVGFKIKRKRKIYE